MAKTTTTKVVLSQDGSATILGIDWEPAIFPLSGIMLDESPHLVKALKTKDEVKRHGHFHVKGVTETGQLILVGCRGRYPMNMFVKLVRPESAPSEPSSEQTGEKSPLTT